MGFNRNTLLSLILFFVALGVLVTIHEFGHFIAAKSFKLYCTDFSIGFGPKILKIKRKKGETTFSVGVLPLGGYVSMVGEDDEEALPEGINVPKERTLTGIKRYKRVIIMSAGVIMNFVLAYIIFFISSACFPQVIPNSWYVVNDNAGIVSLDETVKFDDNDQLVPTTFVYDGEKFVNSENATGNGLNELNILNEGYFTLDSGESDKKYIAALSFSLTGGVNDTDISKNIYLYETDGTKIGDTEYCAPLMENNRPVSYVHKEGDEFKIEALFASATSRDTITTPNVAPTYNRDDDNKLILYPCEITLSSNESVFNPLNVSFYKYDYRYGWEAFGKAGDQWAESTTLISQALGNLFIGQGWDQLGGPIAIFSQTTTILQNNPFYSYLSTWGVLSVNLALFNLLPFPGLDGWQILVEIIEGSVNGIRKLKYKTKNKDEKVKAENTNTEPALEIHSNQNITNSEIVTANKDVNLTIGKETNKENSEFKEWEVPTKVKAIMSYVGLGLLLALMVAIFIKDIIGLF